MTCTFTGTAPPAGSNLVDTVSSTVHEVGNPGNSATKTDTATVTTPTPLVPVLSVFAILQRRLVRRDHL